jgi:hypothetical protein
LNHGRKDNTAVDLAVAKGFPFVGMDEFRDIIALLMSAPDPNIFETYRYAGQGKFDWMGIL